VLSPAGSAIADALSVAGIAAVQIDGTPSAADVAKWITNLRNDERFPTTTVFAEGPALANAVIAARAARADGIVTRGPVNAATGELDRVVAAKFQFDAEDVADPAVRIAAFARSVPVLGRRGTSAARPATARRSPRQVLLVTVGNVLVGLEWGSPQKRGREIWGGIVKWNDVWMPGADEATTLTTSAPIRIGTLDVPAGDHTFYIVPAPDRFQLIISKDVGQFHTVHDATKELGRTDLTAGTRTDSVEGLTFSMEPRGDGAVLKVAWDTREFAAPVSSASTSLARR